MDFIKKQNTPTLLAFSFAILMSIVAIALGIYTIQSRTDFDTSKSCNYNGVNYKTGANFPAGDSCNQCNCSEGAVSCTEIACNDEENLPINDTSEFYDDGSECNEIQLELSTYDLSISYPDCIWKADQLSAETAEVINLFHLTKNTLLSIEVETNEDLYGLYNWCGVGTTVKVNDEISRVSFEGEDSFYILSDNVYTTDSEIQEFIGNLMNEGLSFGPDTNLCVDTDAIYTANGNDLTRIKITATADDSYDLNEADEIVSLIEI